MFAFIEFFFRPPLTEYQNAAKSDTSSVPTKTTPEAFLEELRINVVAPVVVTQQLLPQLKKKQGGARKVFFVSSVMGSLAYISSMTGQDDVPGGWPFSKSMTYAASKAALSMVAVVSLA